MVTHLLTSNGKSVLCGKWKPADATVSGKNEKLADCPDCSRLKTASGRNGTLREARLRLASAQGLNPSQGEVDALARKFKKAVRKLEKEGRGKRKSRYRPAMFRRLTAKQHQKRRQEHLAQEKMALFDRFFAQAIAGLCQGEDCCNVNAYGVANAASLVALQALQAREKARAKVAALKITVPNWID